MYDTGTACGTSRAHLQQCTCEQLQQRQLSQGDPTSIEQHFGVPTTRDELATWVRSVLPAAQAADKYINALFDLADHDQSGDLSVEELAWLLDSVQDHQHHDSVHHQAVAQAANSP